MSIRRTGYPILILFAGYLLSVFLDLKNDQTENTLLKTLVKENYWLIGSSPSGTSYIDWKNPSKKKKWVLVLGNEGNGISKENQALLNDTISIPKYGAGESLNVAISAGILLSHLISSNIN